MLTKLEYWMHQIGDWKVLLIAAAIGAGAALLRSLKKGYSWGRAFLESATAFILCELVGSILMQYTDLSVGVIFGICGVIGMNSEKVSDRFARLIDAGGDRAEAEIRGDTPSHEGAEGQAADNTDLNSDHPEDQPEPEILKKI